MNPLSGFSLLGVPFLRPPVFIPFIIVVFIAECFLGTKVKSDVQRYCVNLAHEL